MTTQALSSRRWVATPRNQATSGIHSDDQARQLGFEGGFVPGVVLYEHVVVELLRQGMTWLDDGRADFRFRRPVYDGVAVSFTVDAETRTFAIEGEGDSAPRALGHLYLDDEPLTIPAGRPAQPTGDPLGDRSQIGILMQIEHAADPSATPVTAPTGFSATLGDRRLVPVGRWCNPIDLIGAYFDSSTTIHLRGRIWHHSPLFTDESITKRGVITDLYEYRGNQVVKFAVLASAGDGRPLATIEHESVYRLAGRTPS